MFVVLLSFIKKEVLESSSILLIYYLRGITYILFRRVFYLGFFF
nr:MAG TPA: hypothetical protein [Caudoviricetes sp.]